MHYIDKFMIILIIILTLILYFSSRKETFIVADAEDIHNYADLKNRVERKKDNFFKDRLDDPPESCTVKYDTSGTNYMPCCSDFTMRFPLEKCGNLSISQRYTTGPEDPRQYKVFCDNPVRNFYQIFKAIPGELDDWYVRGSNYLDYTDYTHPKKNFKILSPNTKGLPYDQTIYRNIPEGSNFAFHNTPAMPTFR